MLGMLTIGYLNGLREYFKQSVSWIVSYISKLILIFGFVIAGYSVFGAVLGFSLAPFIGFIVALYFAGVPKRLKAFSRKKILIFALPVTIQFVLSQYIINIDLLVLKALVKFPEEIGYYSAASMISKVPVSLLAALNMAIFPAISATTYQNDTIRTKTYVSESLRYLIMLIVPASIMISLTSGELVSLLYSSRYILAGEPLKILILGVFFFGLFAYFLNIIIAAGRPKISMILSAIILFIAFILNLSLIPMLGMIGAALATTLSCLIGAAISALYTYRLFHTLTYKLTILRVLIASAAIIPLFLIKVSGILLLGQYLLAFLLYLAILKVIGELRKDDLRNVMFVFK
jgi:O-antigen/teichoic acid export membrane protein